MDNWTSVDFKNSSASEQDGWTNGYLEDLRTGVLKDWMNGEQVRRTAWMVKTEMGVDARGQLPLPQY